MYRKYEEVVTERDHERELYRRGQRRGRRRTRFVFPRELRPVPGFADWVQEEVRREQQSGVAVNPNVLDTSRGPLHVAAAYKSMFAFGNHYRVASSERPLKTCDSGVATTFRQICRNNTRDGNQVNADVEYVGHIEEILELNYRRHCLVVLVCDFVKANYIGENATIKKDKWGFTLANYDKRFGRVCKDSFAFPRHCEQVFYSNARESPGWRVVLRKEVRGKRVLPNNEGEEEAELFQMGRDEDFEGLRPDCEAGEEELAPAATGEDVLLEAVFRPNRGIRGGRGACGSSRGGRRGRLGGHGGRAVPRTSPVEETEGSLGNEEDEQVEEERLYRGNIDSAIRVLRRRRSHDEEREHINIRQGHHSEEEDIHSNETTSEEEESYYENSSSESSSTYSEHTEDEQVRSLTKCGAHYSVPQLLMFVNSCEYD